MGQYCIEEEFVDFEIDEDIDIDESLLESYNEFESCEIEIPDDINLEDLNKVDDVAGIEGIPCIRFVGRD